MTTETYMEETKSIDTELKKELQRTEIDANASEAVITDFELVQDIDTVQINEEFDIQLILELPSGSTCKTTVPIPHPSNMEESLIGHLMKYTASDFDGLIDGSTVPITYSGEEIQIDESKLPSIEKNENTSDNKLRLSENGLDVVTGFVTVTIQIMLIILLHMRILDVYTSAFLLTAHLIIGAIFYLLISAQLRVGDEYDRDAELIVS